MRKFTAKIFSVAIICALCMFSGCTENNVVDNTKNEKLRLIDTAELLSISESQTYDVLDFVDNKALILISDTNRKNPKDVNDQFTTTYYEKLVLLNVEILMVEKEYKIQKFGICKSALLAFDGVVLSAFAVGIDNELKSSIIYLGPDGVRIIYDGNYTPFGTGPILRRCKGDVLYSYFDYSRGCFGLNKINSNFEVEPIIDFSLSEVDYISDDLVTSASNYAYAIGEREKVTFYIGVGNQEKKIVLPKGTRIHGFDITEQHLVVAIAPNEEGGGQEAKIELYCLESGKLTNRHLLNGAIYKITMNESKVICGFNSFVMTLFELAHDDFQKIDVGETLIHGDFYNVYSDGNKFLISIYEFASIPKLWVVSI